MKKLFYTIVFSAITVLSISSCSDENIKPSDGSNDPCQFGGPNCPKGN